MQRDSWLSSVSEASLCWPTAWNSLAQAIRACARSASHSCPPGSGSKRPLTGPERRIGVRNWHTDILAKLSLFSHLQPSICEAEEADRKRQMLQFVARATGEASAPLHEEIKRASVGPRVKFLRFGGWRHWESLGLGRVRCFRCPTSQGPFGSPLCSTVTDPVVREKEF